MNPHPIASHLGTRWIGRPLLHFPELPSTSTHLKELAASDTPPPFGTVVLADHQTAGYGQHGRRWESQPGTALLFSVLLPAEAASGILPLLAGVAMHEAACRQGAHEVGLKWVNDLVARGRKLGGILAEGRAGRWVVLGIGLNLGTSPLAEGIGLEELMQAPVSAGGFLATCLEALEGWYERWREEGAAPVLARWCDGAAMLGREIRVSGPEGEVAGEAIGLGPQGQLLVRTHDGVRAVLTGTVRMADGAYC